MLGAVLALAACSQEADEALPAGGQAISFSAQVGEASATTRMQNNTWEGQEQVGVQIGDVTKTYTVNDNSGKMTTADADPFMWKEGNGKLEVKAWYPMATEAISFTNQADDENYWKCDLLTGKGTAESENVTLKFTHAVTKVNYVVQDWGGYSVDEQNAAQIYFMGYGSATYTGGQLVAQGKPDQQITPKKTNASEGSAMMVPCNNMWDEPLIKIVVGGDTYIYTPTRADEDDTHKGHGELVAHAVQTYYLTIKKKQLTVTMTQDQGTAAWENDRTFGDGDVTTAQFKVNIPEAIKVLSGYEAKNVDDNGFIDDAASGFTISYTEDGIGGLNCTGTCDITRTTNGTTHTYTFKNIAGDLTLSYAEEYVVVGDYYYSDGSWGSEATKEGITTLGRVFKIGAGAGDVASNYTDKGMTKIRGYVACTMPNDVKDVTYAWMTDSQGTYANLLADLSDQGQNTTDYVGYVMTQSLRTVLGSHTALEADFPLWHAFINLSITAAPEVSSGWYIPSLAQLKDLQASQVCGELSGVYCSSNIYFSTEPEPRGWAYYLNKNGAGWASDPGKLIVVLTF